MTRVLLLGPNGMLGEAIRLTAPDDIEVVPPHGLKRFDANGDWHKWDRMMQGSPTYDCIINTIGVLPDNPRTPDWMAHVNATLPHIIAGRASHVGVPVRRIPVIHVSTDCVYGAGECRDGNDRCMHRSHGPDAFLPAPDTHYGRTKLAGESDLAINVRTSFVGPRHGLWKWFVDQRTADPKGSVDGWINALWSGSTVVAVAKALLELARKPGDPRTLHLATETPITKFDLLFYLQRQLAFNDWDLDGAVTSTDEPRIDRSLAPDIVLPPFEEALREMVP